MKRAAKYGLIAVLAAALIGAGVWGAAWLVGTTDGARWLMDAVSRHTPLTISARQVEGRLLDRLRLGGVRVVLAPFEVEIERLDYRWQPLLLLSGRVAAKELTLTGRADPGQHPRGHSAGSRLAPGLRIGGAFRRADRAPAGERPDLPPSRRAARECDHHLLLRVLAKRAVVPLRSCRRCTVRPHHGEHRGRLFPAVLPVDLAVTPAVPVAGMDAFSLQGRFLPGRSPEQLAGGFTVAGSSGKVKRLELAGEAGMTRKAFNLRQLRLTGPGRRGTVTGGGTVTLTAREPLLALQLGAAGLDLAPELNVPTDLSGTLTLTGTPGLYRGEFTLANRGKGWQTARLSGSYQGDSAGVKLAPLTGSLLAGSVQGSLSVRWRDGISLEGTIRGRNLNPAGIDPDWTGVVNFDLAGNGAWPGQAPPRGKVSGRLLESRLHGQALTGEVQADFARGDLHIGRLALQGKGFDINAAGSSASGWLSTRRSATWAG